MSLFIAAKQGIAQHLCVSVLHEMGAKRSIGFCLFVWTYKMRLRLSVLLSYDSTVNCCGLCHLLLSFSLFIQMIIHFLR